MEALEFGYLLMQRRRRLEALASWAVEDEQFARTIVRRTLADTWRARDLLASEVDMDRFLYVHLRANLLARGPEEAGPASARPGQLGT